MFFSHSCFHFPDPTYIVAPVLRSRRDDFKKLLSGTRLLLLSSDPSVSRKIGEHENVNRFVYHII